MTKKILLLIISLGVLAYVYPTKIHASCYDPHPLPPLCDGFDNICSVPGSLHNGQCCTNQLTDCGDPGPGDGQTPPGFPTNTPASNPPGSPGSPGSDPGLPGGNTGGGININLVDPNSQYNRLNRLRPSSVYGGGVNLLFGIAGLTAFIYILWGGYSWITAGGDKDAMEKARKRLTGALIGLALVFSVYALIYVIRALFNIDVIGINIGPLNFR